MEERKAEEQKGRVLAGSGRPPSTLTLRARVVPQPGADRRWYSYLLDLLRKQEHERDMAHPHG